MRRAERAGFVAGDRSEWVARLLEREIRMQADTFVGIQELRDLVDAMEVSHPALIAEVVPRAMTLAQIAEILRRLVREGVSILDLRTILEALAVEAQIERDPTVLTELVRSHMKRHLTAAAVRGHESLPVYRLTPNVEQIIYESIKIGRGNGEVALPPEFVHGFVERLHELDRRPRERGALEPVLVVPREIRPFVWELLHGRAPNISVYAYDDLLPSVVLRAVGIVGEAARGST